MGALVLCSCAGFRATERFAIDGTADELRASAQEAAQKLGWSATAAENGTFTITDCPRQHWLWKKPLTVAVKDGELSIEGPSEQPPYDRTYEAARILASATRELRGQIVIGPKVEERSEAMTVALDLFMPAVGALYALRGNPAWDNATGLRNTWSEFFMRVAMDALCVGLALEFELLRLPDGSRSTPQWFAVLPVTMLVTNRIGALLNDLVELPFRNAYARSGLRAPRD